MKNPDRDLVSLNGLSNTVNKRTPLMALPTTDGIIVYILEWSNK